MNGKPLLSGLDIYSDAAGNNTAYERVLKDAEPSADGYHHLEFHPSSREGPLLNALEIVPGLPGKLRPIRLLARDVSYAGGAGVES